MSTFIGRKASSCRKCKGSSHYVNRMGGIVCEACNPPKNAETDVKARLIVEGGVWIDPANRFEMGEKPTAGFPSRSDTATAPRGVPAATSPERVAGRGPGVAMAIPVRGRGPGGEFSLTELYLFGLESIWRVGAGDDLTLVDGRVRWQGQGHSA